jgi:large subunit ribosomal protein L5
MVGEEKSQKKPKGGARPDGGQAAGGKKRRGSAEAEVQAAVEEVAEGPEEKVPARLRLRYEQEIVPALMRELKIENRMRVPKLDKIVINMGLGEATQNTKLLDPLVGDLTAIVGQKPVMTKAKKSIAAFKVRAGMSIGAMVTLRSDKAYEFLDRLISIALPRVRDFRGVSTKSFDGRGNYTLGLRDQLIFPEIDYAKVEKLKGMNITIVTTARDDNGARALLKHFGMPFRQGA